MNARFPGRPGPLRADLVAAVPGLCATLLGIGLGRFAYTPMMPAMIDAGWLDAPAAARAGAANFTGYLLGALLALWPGSARTLPWAHGAVAASLLACALPAGEHWTAAWRLLAGVGGALLMIRAVSACLLSVPLARRPRVSAIAFSGIGLGTVLTALAGAIAGRYGPAVGWVAISLAGAVAAAVGWWTGRRLPAPTAATAVDRQDPVARLPVWLTVGAYALLAVAVTPHALLWVEHMVRARAVGVLEAALNWQLVGLGSLVGPLVAAWPARRHGSRAALAGCGAAAALGLVLSATAGSTVERAAASLLLGASVPAAVSLTSVLLAEQVGAARHARWWAAATLAFALSQSASAAVAAALVGAGVAYAALFSGGAGIAAGACVLLLLPGRRR